VPPEISVDLLVFSTVVVSTGEDETELVKLSEDIINALNQPYCALDPMVFHRASAAPLAFTSATLSLSTVGGSSVNSFRLF
jgi:hypothetical protein